MRTDGDLFLADIALEVLRKHNRPMPFAEVWEMAKRKRTNVKYASLKAALQKLAKRGDAQSTLTGPRRALWEAV